MSYGPGLVGIQLPPALVQYLAKLMDHGMFVGPIGNQSLAPPVQQLVNALHNVLAGGSITVTVTAPGSPAVVGELNTLLSDGNKDANEINKKVGFYLTAVA